MKKGRVSIGVVFVHRPVLADVVGVVAGERCSSLYRLLEGEDKADGSSLRWRISLRTVRRPGGRWRLWERMRRRGGACARLRRSVAARDRRGGPWRGGVCRAALASAAAGRGGCRRRARVWRR